MVSFVDFFIIFSSCFVKVILFFSFICEVFINMIFLFMGVYVNFIVIFGCLSFWDILFLYVGGLIRIFVYLKLVKIVVYILYLL